MHVVSRVGRRLPAHLTALGQALLADLTTDEVDKILPERLDSFTRQHHHRPRAAARGA